MSLNAPENRLDFGPYDIYRKMSRKERQGMQKQIQEDTVRFAAELDDKMLPKMPNTKQSSVLAKRRFLGIVAERQARLQAQIRWLKAEQERNRELQEVSGKEQKTEQNESEGVYVEPRPLGVPQVSGISRGSGKRSEADEGTREDTARERLGETDADSRYEPYQSGGREDEVPFF